MTIIQIEAINMRFFRLAKINLLSMVAARLRPVTATARPTFRVRGATAARWDTSTSTSPTSSGARHASATCTPQNAERPGVGEKVGWPEGREN